MMIPSSHDAVICNADIPCSTCSLSSLAVRVAVSVGLPVPPSRLSSSSLGRASSPCHPLCMILDFLPLYNQRVSILNLMSNTGATMLVRGSTIVFICICDLASAGMFARKILAARADGEKGLNLATTSVRYLVIIVKDCDGYRLLVVFNGNKGERKSKISDEVRPCQDGQL